jgi:actin related protein 2/3 complex subunit 5
MAKNTFSSAFRKIDVDKYNEDNFKEDVVEDGAKDTKIDEKEIQNLLSSNNAGKFSLL